MPPRSLVPPTADAPVRLRLVVGWAVFFLFVLAGLWLLWQEGSAVDPLLHSVGS